MVLAPSGCAAIAALATALLCTVVVARGRGADDADRRRQHFRRLRAAAGRAGLRCCSSALTRSIYPQRVVNASISGDTTAGGRARLPSLLAQHRPPITVIELGGNDGLRGGNLDAMRANLDAMVVAAQKAGSRVLLVGMQLPPNYGPAYVQRFDAIFGDVAKARHVALVPFLFEGFGDDNALFQPDRIHPVVAAQPRLLDNVWRELQPLLGAPRKTP